MDMDKRNFICTGITSLACFRMIHPSLHTCRDFPYECDSFLFPNSQNLMKSLRTQRHFRVYTMGMGKRKIIRDRDCTLNLFQRGTSIKISHLHRFIEKPLQSCKETFTRCVRLPLQNPENSSQPIRTQTHFWLYTIHMDKRKIRDNGNSSLSFFGVIHPPVPFYKVLHTNRKAYFQKLSKLDTFFTSAFSYLPLYCEYE